MSTDAIFLLLVLKLRNYFISFLNKWSCNARFYLNGFFKRLEGGVHLVWFVFAFGNLLSSEQNPERSVARDDHPCYYRWS